MFPSFSPHPLLHRLKSNPFITPPPLLQATMHHYTEEKDFRADNTALSHSFVNYNTELGLICHCAAPAHPIPLSQAFFPALASGLHPPLSSLSQMNNKSVSGSLNPGPILRDEDCIHTLQYITKKITYQFCSESCYLYVRRAKLFFAVAENILSSTLRPAKHKIKHFMVASFAQYKRLNTNSMCSNIVT